MSIAKNRKAASNFSAEHLLQLAERAFAQNDLVLTDQYLNQICTLNDCPVRAYALAGLVAACRKDFDGAAGLFSKALVEAPEDFDARYNLALSYYLRGKHSEALKEFRNLSRQYPEKAEPFNDMGVVWQTTGRVGRALTCFRRAVRTDCNYTPALDNALQCCLDNGFTGTGLRLLERLLSTNHVGEASRQRADYWQGVMNRNSGSALRYETNPHAVTSRKLAFFASHRAFVDDIIASLSQNHEVRIFEGTTYQQMSEMLAWADLAWFEWCDDLLIQATRLPRQCPIICRLHSYEAFTDMPSRVDWTKVDHVVFVNQSVRDLAQSQIMKSVPTSIIHNGVDLNRFVIPSGKKPSKKIGSVGYINYKKNPTLLLYCFKKIYEYDPGYSLHIAGEHQDSRIQLYFEHFLKNNPLPVHFDGWVKDMPAWYADKGYIISTSLFESFHYSIAEGMASGLLPLVHNWYGAENLYPRKFLFEDPDGCLKLLKRLEKLNRREVMESNRSFIDSRYQLNDKLKQIAALIDHVLEHAHTVSVTGNI